MRHFLTKRYLSLIAILVVSISFGISIFAATSGGSGSISVSGVTSQTGPAQVTVTVNGYDTNYGSSDPVTGTASMTVNPYSPTPLPTASLSASPTTVTPPGTITYSWSSTNADTYSSIAYSTATSSCPGTGPWVANTSSGGTSAATLSSQAGCIYDITYTATQSSTGKSAVAQVVISIGQPSVAQWQTGAWGTCTSGTQTRTVSCVDSTGASATGCDPTTMPATSQSCTATSTPPSGSACGTAAGVPSSTVPNSNLCAAGYGEQISGVSRDANNNWYWYCGPGGAAPWSECTAPDTGPIAGQCGSGQYWQPPAMPTSDVLCTQGTASALTNNGDGTYSWTCSGFNGGGTASCGTSAIVYPPPGTMTATPNPVVTVGGSSTSTTISWNIPGTFGGPVCTLTEDGQIIPDPAYADSGLYTWNSNDLYTASPYTGTHTFAISCLCDYTQYASCDSPKQVTVTDIDTDYAITVSGPSVVYPGDTAVYTVKVPFGTVQPTYYYYGATTGGQNTVPSSFPSGLNPTMTLSNQEISQFYSYMQLLNPDTHSYYYPGLGTDPSGYPDAPWNFDYSPLGTFGSNLSSTNGYTSTWTIHIPSNAVPAEYAYSVSASYQGAVRYYPIWLQVGNPANRPLTLTVNKTIGGSVASSDRYISCGVSCSYAYASGTQVTLTETPDSNYWKFIGWTGDCTGNSTTCTVKMTQPRTVSALFSPQPLQYKEF